MDYPFENLSPEKFQQFCQALLTKQFPDVVCLPVGQPDGGRDAYIYFDETPHGKFVVFQVKFVRNPFAEEDPHKWLVRIVEEEAPKIKKLIPRGASKYYLLTNIPGTAHLDVGSIDQMRMVMQQELQLSSECWWRDDLARRVEGAPEIKWAYPELLSGIDVLKQLVESGLTEHRERRARAIKLFLRDQYETEKEVRFKQVELQNRLLDLFIDVPVALRDVASPRLRHLIHNILHVMATETESDEASEVLYQRSFYERDGMPRGAASFFLHHLTQQHLPAVVLEGAPGQGKSTITQYVCQVHRMRLLNEKDDLRAITEQHRAAPIRLPIRIDLRDLATWFSKKNPFSADENDIPATWYKSLESFLAALIMHHSGGDEFTVSDLHAIITLSALLLVFDGLDEVADIAKRQEVVDEISKGINRLREIAPALQVIITSRPAAFANSPGFSNRSFPHCQLENLTTHLILDYAERWIHARKLQGRESTEVRQILKQKLDQPHLRDLAKNPMQLAILLSLIHNRGSSLPDKRTELYDSYIDLFFSREAQKSTIVREHRDLLINIHRYLAWVLQFETEEGKHTGSVSADNLEKLLFDYLSHEGYDTSLVKQLFSGMVERVVALVSRVEGTYEFEVQPLREYFAARYLYVTAPYSPPGSPKRGNKLDRFDAIARNFYWLNVTRFYAGCFDIGELPSLADRLEELTKEEGYRQTNHPRYLAATLLTDWVFAQHPKSLKHVINVMLDGLGLRLLLAANGPKHRTGMSVILPKQCGRDELLSECFRILRENPVSDYAHDVIDLLKLNAETAELTQLWLPEVRRTSGKERTRWVEYGLYLGALAQQPLDTLESILGDIPLDAQRLQYVYRARQLEYLEGTKDTATIIVNAILDRDLIGTGTRKVESIVDSFAESLNALRYSYSMNARQPTPLNELWDRTKRHVGLTLDVPHKHNYEIYDKCREVIATVIRESSRTSLDWATEIAPWDNVVEEIRRNFGDRWACVHLANMAAGIRSLKETCTDHPELLDHSRSLCKRVRYGRLRAGQEKWWEKQFDLAQTEVDVVLVCLILISWGKSHALVELAQKLDDCLKGLSPRIWKTLAQMIIATRSVQYQQTREVQLHINVKDLPQALSPRVVFAFSTRTKIETSRALYQKYVITQNIDDPYVSRFSSRVAFHLLSEDPSNWTDYLRTTEESYARGQVSDRPTRFESARSLDNMPLAAATIVTERAEKYPGWLVSLAEASCRKYIASRIIPVGTIAKRDNWISI